MAIQLRRRKVDVVVLERARDVGGVWRDNTYPGCCCDIPSHVYSYSFALNAAWTRGFAPQREIYEYIKDTAAKHAVLSDVRLGHEVLDAAWDATRRQWRIQTSEGPLTADLLINAAGALSDPALPELPGLESFRGTTFHSARWNENHDLTGARVAVIGTGASAIQFVPAIAPQVEQLYVFQRTAPWVIPRLDHQISRFEHAALRLPGVAVLVRAALYWLNELRLIAFRKPTIMRLADRAARRHLRRQVPDPELRGKLTPGYLMGCKRILISDDYYPALTQPNVDVITDPISEIRPESIVTTSGQELPVDTIIFGTGFHVLDAPIAERIRGKDGRTLAEHWRGSMEAYKGTAVAGFPNLFCLLGPNTGLGHNSMIYMMESQFRYVMETVAELDRRGASTVEVRPAAQARYNQWLQRKMRGTVWTAGHCQSWYLDSAGRNPTLWPSWSWRYRLITRRFDRTAYDLA
jgi:cation diffusion facilitator CzcD-associated flavoprotein CzcO